MREGTARLAPGLLAILLVLTTGPAAAGPEDEIDPSATRPVEPGALAEAPGEIDPSEPIAVEVPDLEPREGNRLGSDALPGIPVVPVAGMTDLLWVAATADPPPGRIVLHGHLRAGEERRLEVGAARVAFAGGPTWPDDLPALVTDLADPSWGVRERASTWLARLGRSARPVLRRALDDADPERAARARVLLADLRWRPPGPPDPTARAWVDLYRRLPPAGRRTLLQMVPDRPGPAGPPGMGFPPNARPPRIPPAALGAIARAEDDPAVRLRALSSLFAAGNSTTEGPWREAVAGTVDDLVAGGLLGPEDGAALARILLVLDRPGDALERARAELEAAPDHRGLLGRRALALARLGRGREAAAAWRDLAASAPRATGRAEALFAAADALVETGDPETAVALLAAHLEREGEELPARFWVRATRLLRDLGREGAARRVLLAGLERHPGNRVLLAARARDLARAGEAREAFHVLRLLARQEVPDGGLAKEVRGVLEILGRPDLLDDRFLREVGGRGRIPRGRLEAARALVDRGLPEEAADELLAGRLLYDRAVFPAELAALRRDLGAPAEEVRSLLTEARDLDPADEVRRVIERTEERMAGTDGGGTAPVAWTAPPIRDDRTDPGPGPWLARLADGTLACGHPDGIVGLDPRNGRVRWEIPADEGTRLVGLASPGAGLLAIFVPPGGRRAGLRPIAPGDAPEEGRSLAVPGPPVGPPASGDGRAAVVFQGSGRATLALWADGDLRWERSFRAWAVTPPSLGDRRVAVGTDEGEVVVRDVRDGSEVARARLERPVLHRPTPTDDGGWLVGAGDRLVRLDGDGRVTARVDLGARVGGRPVPLGDAVLCPLRGGTILRVSGDAAHEWSRPGRTAAWELHPLPDGDVIGLAGGRDRFSDEDGIVCRIGRDGEVRWSGTAGVSGALVVGGGRAVAAGRTERGIEVVALRLGREADDPAAILRATARSLLEHGEPAGAVRCLERLLARPEEMRDPETWTRLIEAHLGRQAEGEAADALRRGLEALEEPARSELEAAASERGVEPSSREQPGE